MLVSDEFPLDEEELVHGLEELLEEDSVVVPQAVKDRIENASIADKIRFFIMLLNYTKLYSTSYFITNADFFQAILRKFHFYVKRQL